MVKEYKKKRLAEEMSYDSPPKKLKLEGSERGRAKRLVKKGIQDYNREPQELKDDVFDEETRKVIECWENEKNIPGYKCTCFEPKNLDKK